MRMIAKHRLALLLAALIVPILAACGSAGTTSAPTTASAPTAAAAPTAAMAAPTAATAGGAGEGKVALPELDPSTVEGNIITAGSSTVYPLTHRRAELFKDEG